MGIYLPHFALCASKGRSRSLLHFQGEGVYNLFMSTHKQWNSSSDWYDKNMGEYGDGLNHNVIFPVIKNILGDISNKIILDSGCGSGYFAAKLAKKAKKVVGTDFAETFIKLCENKYQDISNLSFFVHDVTKNMPFNDGAFDFVVSKMVLQYVSTLDIFANETKRVLNKGGKLIITVDHPFNTQFYYAQTFAGKTNPKYPHLKDYFDRSEQKKLSLWGKVELTWYPKTMSDYIQSFIDVKLNLIKIIELPEQNVEIKIPRILALVFQK